MNLSAALLPAAWYLAANVAMLAIGIWILRTAPWKRLVDGAFSHVWLGSCVALLVLWTIRPVALAGFDFHLLGATIVTLMFGPQLAIAGMALVMAGLVALGRADLHALSANVLVLAVLPAFVSHGVFRLSDRMLPRNIFVYIFVPAFFGAAVAMESASVAATGLRAVFGNPTEAMLAVEFLPYCFLLSFAEATLTGMLVTLMVVYRPAWIGTFDDARYLQPR